MATEVLMKNAALGLSFVFSTIFSSVTYACVPQTAQYIGNVKNATQTQTSKTATKCSYEIEYSMFNSSYACPLDVSEVFSARFEDQDCDLRNGDQVSGIIAKINGNIVLE